jgi:DNA-directed RNA polymerase subunit alpha
VLEIPITDFELSVRSRNCLKKMNIHTLGDLLRVSETELLGYKNFGETSLNEIRAVLAQKGLRLGQAAEEERTLARRVASNLVSSAADQDVLSKSCDDLELSVRARRCLERLGLNTLGEVASRTEAELLATKNFGVTSLNEIKQQLTVFGLALRRLEE